jgi:hypothetical protein
MFRGNRIRSSDPFRLSALGRCRAAVAWLRGPALMRRWLLLLLSVMSAVSLIGIVIVFAVMQPASPAPQMAVARTPDEGIATLLRAGPSSSEVVDLPGYDCHPMPALGLKYLNPMRTGPSVVAIGKDGVVWGPACVVTYGVAGS